MTVEGLPGTHFAVWAPNADRVEVIGDFNGWDGRRHLLCSAGSSGVFAGFLPGVLRGDLYKYRIHRHDGGPTTEKADPLAVRQETPPRTASVVWDTDYEWGDAEWMKTRGAKNALDAPISVYEVHLGSFLRVPEDGFRSLHYREIAPKLAAHVKAAGFTHVELLPVMEHPFYGSWGYQVTGYFAPTSRYGTPQDFMALIDHLHQEGIGVILDWVPSHFPADPHGLGYFDGTHLYEHADRRKGHHPDWDSLIFNYDRNEVRSFLVSAALHWLRVFHADGLRTDAVASMLYLDYSRKDGEWIPNEYGGRENLGAIRFMKEMNQAIYEEFPDVQTIAEESTAWPMVSHPVAVGGLGFGMKWDMGWMHDTLTHLSREPIYRRFHQNELTFRQIYSGSENFMLSLSHDEVVHGKGSLVGKMPGDDWRKFANLRLLYGDMFAQTGKKLLFMGGEIAQRGEWAHEGSIEWHLLDYRPHQGMLNLISELNRIYREVPALYEKDCGGEGFSWVDCTDEGAGVLSFLRWGRDRTDPVLVVLHSTPAVREDYRIGVPFPGTWKEVLNTDEERFGGSGQRNPDQIEADPVPAHGHAQSLSLRIPPLGAMFLRRG
jgi:1,4-alpha-glucan branching enzyme